MTTETGSDARGLRKQIDKANGKLKKAKDENERLRTMLLLVVLGEGKFSFEEGFTVLEKYDPDFDHTADDYSERFTEAFKAPAIRSWLEEGAA